MELLAPVNFNSSKLQNKIVMAPMTRSRANNPEYTPTDIHAKYYGQRASAGLIITEGTIVSEQGRGYINTPGIYSKKQVDEWRKVTDEVHKKGGKIYVQIWHVGRISHPDFHNGSLPVAPSAINPNIDVYTNNGYTKTVTPKALTKQEIKGIVSDFKNAGKNALKAGFDGVEIHSSNGYLFHQFFSNSSNKRKDEYGGNDENKTRFFFEVLEALKEVLPENKIGARLNPMLHGMFGITIDKKTAGTFDYLVKRLNDYNLAYLHLSRPGKTINSPHFIKDVIGHYREIYNGFLIANGNYNQESSESEITSKRADAVAFGVPFIANPDLPERFANKWPLSEADTSTFYTPGEKGYTDYPYYNS